MAEIQWDQHALELYFVEIEERMLQPLAQEVEDVARALAPVRGRHTARPINSRRAPGMGGNLKASVQHSIDHDMEGTYADIAALWYGRFLDPPAKQIKRLIPFLPSALIMVVDGRNFYL